MWEGTEDALLPPTLQGDNEASYAAPMLFGSSAIVPRARPRAIREGQVSWLMKTTYISQDSDTARKQGVTEKAAKAMRDASGVT